MECATTADEFEAHIDQIKRVGVDLATLRRMNNISEGEYTGMSPIKKLNNNIKYCDIMKTVQILVIILIIAFAIVVIVVGLGGLEVLLGKPMLTVTSLNTISPNFAFR